MNFLKRIKDVMRHHRRLKATAREKSLRQVRAPDLLDLLNEDQIKESALTSRRLMCSETSLFTSREGIRSWSFRTLPQLHKTGMILEFGVDGGKSLVQIASSAGRRVFGFDAFEGLRDAWSKPGRTVGSMDRGGRVPKLLRERQNVKIVQGWVEDTLEPFLRENPDSISIAHLDMDVYPPTKFVLQQIKPRLGPGSFLIFDDFFGFIGWQNHSYRALFDVFSEEELVAVALSPSCAVFRLSR